MSEFAFADDRDRWPSSALNLRYQELLAIVTIDHGQERKEAISRELSHLLFEMTQREPVPADGRLALPGTWKFPAA